MGPAIWSRPNYLTAFLALQYRRMAGGSCSGSC
jgi:hypothetical protein